MTLEIARRLADDGVTWETVVVDEDTGNGGSQPEWIVSATFPDNSIGNDGDFCLVTNLGYIAEKAAGSWAYRAATVTPGGTAGQVFAKQDEFDGDYEWITPADAGIPQGGPLTEDLDADGNDLADVSQVRGIGGGLLAFDGAGTVNLSATAGDSLIATVGSADLVNLTDTAGGSIGFFGHSPAARPEVPAVPTEQDIVDALVALGLVTQAAP